ncbi:TonB-dependent receptor [Arcticibacter svalbardensis MN12-7]|uniref:TonB-dependent receptor n=1 Tax=Arcticibacter svalbardensis MN12-7 TaxID=1150600 RepID=R9GP47_9SPHI|nr:TonB-dependent receptor [Arcticibacter svalbardensis]EOR93491.1 TonB-dependent receptor [Arcticibacter svalbardensis MN12-7]
MFKILAVFFNAVMLILVTLIASSGDSKATIIPVSRHAQDLIVTGKVVDEKREPLPGVSVRLKNTTIATSTDSEGNYRIAVPRSGAVLVFNMLGFSSLERVVTGTSLNVSLETTSSSLEEVVVVGYGTQKVATVTGSISSVKGDVLTSSPAINLSNSLAGRLPGLVAVTRSGEPGGDASTLRIRGGNTLGDNSPLIVVDGISNRGLERLNPNDIESVTILKDASAAIYGAQAANGVILITTKKGKLGKPQVTLTYNQGYSTPTVIPESTDAATYLEMLNEISSYAGQAPKYTPEILQKYRDGSDPWLYPNTDWFAETFQDAAPQTTANLNISGGQENLRYFISAGMNNQDGIYKNSATKYKQMDFRINLDGNLSKYLKYGINVAAREENRNYPTRSAADIFSMIRRGKPNMPAFWPNGMNGPDIEYGNNPVVITTSQTGYDRNKTNILQTNARFELTVPWVQGLSLTGNAALDKRNDNDKLWQIPWYLYSWDGVTYDANNSPVLIKGQKGFTNPQLTQEMEDSDLLTLNMLLNYQKSFKEKHNLKFLLGVERISGETMGFSAFRKNFISPTIDQLFAGGDAEKTNSGSASEQARLNYFGRVNYDFKGKYLFEFLGRYDGSYIFPESKRFGFFPGVSLGWRVSEEKFWKPLSPVISNLKIRGSWGQTGNDRISTYQYLSSYGFATGASNVYTFNSTVENKILSELRIPNRNVTWEVANQSNIGVDGELFKGKVFFTAEYFYNHRTDILWQRNASVPSSSGLTLPSENIGEVINKGTEFELGYRNNDGAFKYSVSANLSSNNNKIEFWDETPGIPEYQQSTGNPMNAALIYKAIGIFHTQADVDAYPHWTNARPGDIIFEDVNNDGVIDGLDKIRMDKTDLPTKIVGLNLNLSYKGIYANLLFQGALGAVRNNYFEMQGEGGNYLIQDVEGRWTTENPDADKPRIWNRYSEYWRSNSNTYWYQSSDYLRLKNLEIGYTLPASFTKKLAVSNAQIYFSGMNLLTFTKVKDFDPESVSGIAYPLNKVYNLGISLTF